MVRMMRMVDTGGRMTCRDLCVRPRAMQPTDEEMQSVLKLENEHVERGPDGAERDSE
jgi:hypothetical protein